MLVFQNTLSAQTSNAATMPIVNQDLPLGNVANQNSSASLIKNNSSGSVLVVSKSENSLKPLQELHQVALPALANDSATVAPKIFDPLTMDSKPE